MQNRRQDENKIKEKSLTNAADDKWLNDRCDEIEQLNKRYGSYKTHDANIVLDKKHKIQINIDVCLENTIVLLHVYNIDKCTVDIDIE
ncbi:hypothetical protein FQA39_LY05752 [Lamprigera yunnana]|nr:hypothetical protein FQA39_LY05752 [Lamprigera yunnana]